jgi:hypothetical protein
MDIFLPVFFALISIEVLKELYNQAWSVYYSRKWKPDPTD